ncbi:MAG: hypothetical protein HY928_02330 [Elusimicrobia bacterium]|nr:hypothetical protein [Elusimicrobiota bacterium]
MSFTIDSSSPTALLVFQPSGIPVPPAVSATIVGDRVSVALSTPVLDVSSFSFSFSDAGSGLADARVFEDGLLVFSAAPSPPSTVPVTGSMSLREGSLYELDLLDALGRATRASFYVDVTSPSVTLGSVKFSSSPALDRPALYAIDGTASDGFWLKEARVFRFQDINFADMTPALYESLPAVAISSGEPSVPEAQRSSAFSFTGLSADQYVVIAMDAAGHLSQKELNVQFQETAINGDGAPYDCRVALQGGTDLLSLRRVADGSFASSGSASGIVSNPLFGVETLGTLIKALRVELGTTTAAFTGLPLGSPQDGTVTLAVRTAAPHDPSYLDLFAPPSGTFTAPTPGLLLPGGALRLRVELEHNTAGTFPGFTSPLVGDVRLDAVHYLAHVVSAGDGPMTSSRASFGPGSPSAVLDPEGRAIAVEFPDGVNADGTASAALVLLNPDPTCGYASATPPASVVATAVSADPVFNGRARVTLPLDPALAQADMPFVQARLRSGNGPENITDSVDPAAGRITALSDALGVIELLLPTGSDRVPPATAFLPGTPLDPAGDPVVAGGTAPPLSASDQASGVLMTQYRLGTGPYFAAARALNLPSGKVDIHFRSWDEENNLEPTHHRRILVDAEPPVITALFPSSATFGDAVSSFTVAWTLLDDLDPAPTAQARLMQLEDTGTPNSGSTVVVVALGRLFFAPELDDGSWVLEVTARDWVLNSTAAYSVPFQIVHPLDSTPPHTQLTLGPPSVLGDPSFVSSQTVISLAATDDLSGVASLTYAIDGSTSIVLASSASFSLAQEGPKNLAYSAVDVAGNIEPVQTSSITVDNTPPAPLAVFPASGTYIGQAPHFLSASFSDPEAAPGFPGSGLDPGAFKVFDGAVELAGAVPAGDSLTLNASLGEGSHLASFHAADRVANAAVAVTSFTVDLTPPSIALLSTGPYYTQPRPTFAAAFNDQLSGLATGQLSLSLGGPALTLSPVLQGGDGKVTAWQTAPSLSFPVVSHAMASLGGFLYSLGGHKNVNLGGDEVRTEVFASPLGPGGAPGAWTATTALPARLAGHSAVAVNGRLYVLGGARTGTAAVNTVYFASPVGPNGALGTWSTAAALPQAISGLDAVGVGVGSIGPYLYALGGQDAAGQTHREVYVAPLDPVGGAPGSWTATTLLPEPLGSPRVVEWNRRLYVMGGITQPALSSITNKVWSAPVQAGGLLGAWRAEPDLPAGRYGAEAVSAMGRVYSLGGWDAAAVPHAEVNSAEVGTDGVLGAWRPEAPLHLPLVALAAAATAEGIYYGGGMTAGNAAVADARFTRVDAGTPGSARLEGVPEEDLADGQYTLTAAGTDRVGNATSASALVTVDGAPPAIALSAAGAALSSAALAFVPGALPELVASFSDAVSGIDPSGVTLSLDGLDVTTQAAVSAAQARFTPAPPFAPGRHSLEAAARDLAGNQARLTADFILDPEPPAVALSSPAPGAFFSSSTVQFAAGFSDGLSGLATGQLRLSWEGGSLQPALSFTEGSGGTGWQTAPALAFPVVSHAMAALGGTLYSLGGHKNVNLGGDEVRTEVFASPLGPGGAPGAWTATTALPARLAGHSAVAVNGRVYVLGGARTGTAAVNTVYYSSLVGTAGTVTGWTTAAALPQAISGLDAVGVGVGSIGPYLYALGGQDAGGLPHREVYVAPLDPASGAPGGWTATTLLPEPLGSPEVVEWNQRLYVMGGITQPALSSITNKVWSAPVQAGGLLGAWRAEPDLPAGRYGAEAVSVQGRVYYLGGWDAAAVPHAEVNSAEVGTDGVLGTWRAEAPLHLPLVALAAAATAEGIYYGGGMTTGNAAVADARWRGLRTGVASAAALALAQGLPEGPHEARAEAADRAGNTALSSAAFFVDLTPPDTRLVVAAASRTFNGDLYVLGVPTVSFSVTDGPEGAASGLGQTLFSVDAGSEAPAGDFVAPPAGWSTLRFRSVDAVGNAEIAKSSAVKLDAVPPAAVTDLAGTALSTSAIRLTWTVPGDDGASGDIADGSAGVAFSRLEAQTTGGAGTVAAAGSLRAGAGLSWTAAGLSPDTLYYAAAYTQDTAGNWSPASAPVAVRTLAEDVLPPRTRLVATGPQVPGTTLFITPQTSLTLSATDDLLVQGDGAGVGVAGSAYSLDSASLFTDYQSSFSITAQTAHDLRYFSTDRVAHVEEIKLTSVAVDGTGPAVALGYQVPFRTWLGTTTVFVQGLGPLFISATDYPALAVGTSVVYLSVDGADAQASPAPFSLPEGLRSLALWAVDRLGTQGSTVTASLKLDATAPSAALDLTMAALSSSAVTVSWTAPGDDGASGDIYDAAVRLDFGTDPGSLAQSLVLSSGALAVGMRLTQAFSGLAPGTTYFAAVLTRDSAGNWSDPAGAAARTFSVAVSADNVAPLASPVPAEVTVVSTVTESQAYTVAIASQGLTPAGSVFYELTGGLVFSTAAPALISFTFDPVLVDSASVAIYTYDIQTMNWSTASIFNQTLALLESGLYQVSGEILHTSLYAPMVRDTAPPLTAFSVLGSSAVLEGRLFAVGGSSGVLSAQDLAPLGGTPSGVAATRYRGGVGPETVYNAPFALPEGDIHLEFHSLDRSGNAEPLKEARVFVDGTPPHPDILGRPEHLQRPRRLRHPVGHGHRDAERNRPGGGRGRFGLGVLHGRPGRESRRGPGRAVAGTGAAYAGAERGRPPGQRRRARAARRRGRHAPSSDDPPRRDSPGRSARRFDLGLGGQRAVAVGRGQCRVGRPQRRRRYALSLRTGRVHGLLGHLRGARPRRRQGAPVLLHRPGRQRRGSQGRRFGARRHPARRGLRLPQARRARPVPPGPGQGPGARHGERRPHGELVAQGRPGPAGLGHAGHRRPARGLGRHGQDGQLRADLDGLGPRRERRCGFPALAGRRAQQDLGPGRQEGLEQAARRGLGPQQGLCGGYGP